MIIKTFMTIGIHFQNGLKDNPVSICLKNAMKVMQKKSKNEAQVFIFSQKRISRHRESSQKKMSLNKLH